MRLLSPSTCRLAAKAGLVLAAGLAVALRPAALAAQEIAVPVAIQMPLLVKILGFDRNLASRAHGQVILAVLYQSRFRVSADVAAEVRQVLKRSAAGTVGGLEVRVILIDLDQTSDLPAALAQQRVTVLYVAPLRAVDLDAVTASTRSARVTTLTGVTRYVKNGVAIGIDLQGERPQIVVNLPASRAEGADLNAQLLKLARIVQ